MDKYVSRFDLLRAQEASTTRPMSLHPGSPSFAKTTFDGICAEIKSFEAALGADEGLAMYLPQLDQDITIERVAYRHPFLIIFIGTLDGSRCQLVQHMNQTNFLMHVTKKKANQPPIGYVFHRDDETALTSEQNEQEWRIEGIETKGVRTAAHESGAGTVTTIELVGGSVIKITWLPGRAPIVEPESYVVEVDAENSVIRVSRSQSGSPSSS